MHPPFSVIFFTTLAGSGQGLFIALFSYQVLTRTQAQANFLLVASFISVSLLLSGLVASMFHLGHPERGWRAASRWRTSWLSREVIVLPCVIALISTYFLIRFTGFDKAGIISLEVAAVTTVMVFLLFICTSMIYACLRFLQEWRSPLTVINFCLLGLASGFNLAIVIAFCLKTPDTFYLLPTSMILTFLAGASRIASLYRNKRLHPKSTIQSALGIKHPNIRQISHGAMGGSFNTKEFFHGKTREFLRLVKWFFLFASFIVPLALMELMMNIGHDVLIALTVFGIQFLGLVAERWYFFAEANHPQNIYYQSIA
jgi:DMSO reductase anchor subunit